MRNKRTFSAILGPALALMVITGYLGHTGCSPQAGPPEKIAIGTNLNEMVGLLFIAEKQGFYQAQGLEAVIKEYQTGLAPLKDLEEGRLDLASCAEFALAGEVLAGRAEKLRCLAVIAAGEVDFLIARRDRGITRPEDLRAKTVGVPRKTSAEFFLAGFLTLNNIALGDVTVVDVRPGEMADALAGGKVDAVLVWAPVTDGIIKKLGNNAVVWPAQGGQNVYRLLVTREEVIRTRGAVLERLLRALDRAADFLERQPEAGKGIIAQRLQVSTADLQSGKAPINYEPFLDQGLLLAMEDQARWLIKNRLTDKSQVPNFLNYIHAEPLSHVDPKAVRLVLPGKEAAK